MLGGLAMFSDRHCHQCKNEDVVYILIISMMSVSTLVGRGGEDLNNAFL